MAKSRVWKWITDPLRFYRNRRILSAPTILWGFLGLSATLLLFLIVRRWEMERLKLEFDRVASDRHVVLKGKILNLANVLYAIRSFFNASQKVERSEFHLFVNSCLRRDPTVMTLEWIPRVPWEERNAFEEAARAEDLDGFHFHETNSLGVSVESPPRPEYFPSYFIEPLDGAGRHLLGYDYSSNPTFQNAMEKARDSDSCQSIRGEDLWRTEYAGGREGCHVTILPVYRSGCAPITVGERRDQLVGFLAQSYWIGEMAEEALKGLRPAGVDMFILEEGAGEGKRFLFKHPSRLWADNPVQVSLEDGVKGQGIEWRGHLDVEGRKWSLLCRSNPEFIRQNRSFTSWCVLGFGLLVTTVLTLYFTSLRNRAIDVAALVEQRTAELRSEIEERKKTEKALGESQERYRGLIESIQESVWEVDPTGKITYISPMIKEIQGYEPEELLRKDAFLLFAPEERPRIEALFGNLLKTRRSIQSIETISLHKDGRRLFLETSCAPFFAPDGSLLGFRGVGRDIKDRKFSEKALAWESSLNESMSDLACALVSASKIEEISALVLEQGKRLTKSQYGLIGYIDPTTGDLICPTLAREALGSSQIEGKSSISHEFEGLWGWVLTNRKSLMANDLDWDPRTLGTKERNNPIRRFLAAPSMAGEALVGQVAVANSSRDYSRTDLKIIDRLASLYAFAVQRKLSEEELKARAKRQEVVARLGMKALEGKEPSAIIADALAAAADALGVPCCDFWELSSGGDLLSFHSTFGGPVIPEEGLRISPRNHPLWLSLRRTHPLVLGDSACRRDRDAENPFHDLGYRSSILLAVPGPERPFGTLALHSPSSRTFTQHELNCLQSIANLLAIAIHHRGEEKEHRSIAPAFSQAAESIMVLHPDRTIAYVNQTFERITGCSGEEVLGKIPLFLRPGDLDQENLDRIWIALLAGTPWKGELIQRGQDGTPITLQTDCIPLRSAQGEISHIIFRGTEIGERKKPEADPSQARKLEQPA